MSKRTLWPLIQTKAQEWISWNSPSISPANPPRTDRIWSSGANKRNLSTPVIAIEIERHFKCKFPAYYTIATIMDVRKWCVSPAAVRFDSLFVHIPAASTQWLQVPWCLMVVPIKYPHKVHESLRGVSFTLNWSFLLEHSTFMDSLPLLFECQPQPGWLPAQLNSFPACLWWPHCCSLALYARLVFTASHSRLDAIIRNYQGLLAHQLSTTRVQSTMLLLELKNWGEKRPKSRSKDFATNWKSSGKWISE